MGNGGAPSRWEREFKGHIRNPVGFLVMWWTTRLGIHRRPPNDLRAPWAIDECNLASQLNRIELMKHFEQSILVIDPYFNLSVYLPYSHMCRIWPEKNPHPRLRRREKGILTAAVRSSLAEPHFPLNYPGWWPRLFLQQLTLICSSTEQKNYRRAKKQRPHS